MVDKLSENSTVLEDDVVLNVLISTNQQKFNLPQQQMIENSRKFWKTE